MAKRPEYPFGYSDEEAQRLEIQAALIEDLLEITFRKAGLTVGMHVLDLGCGVGDVSFLVARMVGPTGSVLGIDRAEPSIARARRRASAAGIRNVAFEQADLTSFMPEQTFDAVVGRFVLLYLREPEALLSRLRGRVRPGGVFAIQEQDLSQASQSPPSELFQTVYSWISGAFDVGGAEREMGSKLHKAFLDAGLPRPTMMAMTPLTSGPDSPYYEFLTQIVRSMMPVIERARLASPSEIDIDTLTARLRHDAVSNERLLYPPRLISAWSALPD
jgi:cyclopropane fatty-acyl-phospholipid synthase-like methyltransferase